MKRCSFLTVLTEKLAGSGGYRLAKVQGHDGPDFLSLKMGGFTFGLELSL
jgi:hypothetical protein